MDANPTLCLPDPVDEIGLGQKQAEFRRPRGRRQDRGTPPMMALSMAMEKSVRTADVGQALPQLGLMSRMTAQMRSGTRGN